MWFCVYRLYTYYVRKQLAVIWREKVPGTSVVDGYDLEKTLMSDLKRFLEAQKDDYDIALAEIRSGHKRSHWIWYIFPQIAGLGFSSTAQYYAIKDRQEAVDYINDEILRNRLIEISEALLSLDSDDAEDVMGYPDDLKLRSSMTLFNAVAPKIGAFQKVLDKFYDGEADQRTLDLLSKGH